MVTPHPLSNNFKCDTTLEVSRSHQVTEADVFKSGRVSAIPNTQEQAFSKTVIIGRHIPTNDLLCISILSLRIGSKRDR